jgi:predicted house-cleaning noncanonical NTP pyrophosphatase (MazG superfamily)
LTNEDHVNKLTEIYDLAFKEFSKTRDKQSEWLRIMLDCLSTIRKIETSSKENI